LTASTPDLSAASAGRFKSFRRTKLYDLIVAAPVIAWFGLCAVQTFSGLMQQAALVKMFAQTDLSVIPISLVLDLVSKAVVLIFQALLVVLFAIRSVPRAGAGGFLPRFAAIVGTFLAIGITLLPPRELPVPLHALALLLTIGGFGFMIWAAIRLGRSISLLPEARRLVTDGPYGWVRHPLYVGEAVAIMGIALQYAMPWSLLILALQCAFQFWRMIYEERVLQKAFPEYAAYAERTARLIPGLY
jgi:protein-S-isoprenylcysteine O-methyltransferase Ste14